MGIASSLMLLAMTEGKTPQGSELRPVVSKVKGEGFLL